MSDCDAVVIGAGPNGLVAANALLDAGWSVVVLEAQPTVGGAVRSERDVHPDYIHDTFSSFYPLAAVSPTIRRLGLEDYGLQWSHAPAVVANPFGDGRWAVLHRDQAATAAGLDADTPGDGAAWLELCAGWQRIGQALVDALLSPFPPVRHGVRAAARVPGAGGLSFVRMLLAPVRSVAAERFTGNGASMLLAANAAHTDIPADAPGSGVMGWLLAMVGQHLGFPVPVGGAGQLTEAMAARVQARGGVIHTSTRAVEVVVRDGRAVAVRTDDGTTVAASRAVIADTSAPTLYGGLVSWDDLPGRWRRKMAGFEWDPGTVKVDWALNGPIPWTNAPAEVPGTVHVAENLDELADAEHQIGVGAVPARPFLLVGQMAAADPTRAPAGAESVWAYTHVPQVVRSDAGDSGITGSWDAADCERMADRMQTRIERYAPGFTERVIARRVLGPRQLEARDANLHGGALNGGTASLHQQLVFRPVPGLGRAETPIKQLYLGSASAHPGGGVHGACGANAARAALAHDRVARIAGIARWRPGRR
jgi:phytoene dehydrogenase-like protein